MRRAPSIAHVAMGGKPQSSTVHHKRAAPVCYASGQSNFEFLKAPMKILKRVSLLALLFFPSAWHAGAQATPATTCNLDLPSLTTTAPNIFSDKQEQDLGDAWAEYYEARIHLEPPAADDQLTRIGQRLLATLPPTGVQYRFRVWDSGEINAFSLAGGHVYISRKLIAAVKNEDDLAGVMAHEIGHIYTHQIAITFTRALRLRLGITQVTDRADIFAKVHQLMNTPPKPFEKDVSDEDREVLADRLALYELVRAGYSPESFAAFMDESMMNKGKTGNFLSDILGNTRESAKRYREALQMIADLPSNCKGRAPQNSDAFNAWQHTTLEERAPTAADTIDGDQPMKLDPPLRSSLSRIRFSPDGRLLLAQDESGITIMDKEAGKVLFRIDAPGVKPAQFTPDSKSVIFNDAKLRVEQWSVADGKRTSVKELVVFEGCNQTMLAPDGKTFACAFANVHGDYLRIGLRLIDVESGKSFFENEGFFEPGLYTAYAQRLYQAGRTRSEADLMDMLASPDGKYFLLVAGNRVLAYDLASRQPIQLSGKLKDLSQARMAFVGPDKLYAVFQAKAPGIYVTRVMTFPDGQVVKETEIGNQQVESVTKGDNLIVFPLKDYPVGILDPVQGKVLTAAKLWAIDAWDSTVALEDAMGGVAVAQMGASGSKHISLPLGPLPVPSAAAFSSDGKYLAVSMKTRAAIWNLETGALVKLVRPFSSAYMNDAGNLIGQFPKYISFEAAELQMTMNPFASKELGKPTDSTQFRDLEHNFKSMDKDKAPVKNGVVEIAPQGTAPGVVIRFFHKGRHETLEVRKMATQAVAWSRDYPDETPECWPGEGNQLVLVWDVTTVAAKSEIVNSPALSKQFGALKNQKKALLVETVDAETGAPLEKVIVPDVNLYLGWDDNRRAMVSGKVVLSHSVDGVTAIYHIEDGTLVGEFIGSVIAADASAGIVAAVNRQDEILLVEESTGNEIKRISFASPVRLAHIVTGKENSLLVLTADQTVHRIPLPVPASALTSPAAQKPN
jgi:WD40 repeat protein